MMVAVGGCAADAADTDGSEASSSGLSDVATPATDAPKATTRGGAHATPIAYADPDLKCYPLIAYQSPDARDQKYSVPTTPDFYVNFTIKAPWPGKQYIKAFRSIIDNKAVLHHWLLYRQLPGSVQAEGVQLDVSGAHPDGELLYGWAPGGDDLYLDPDLGIAIDQDSYFQLETHYNNLTSGPKSDGSGVEVCVTPHAPEHLAAQSWLGNDRINGTTASGTCTPENKVPVHVILANPHMHKKGVHMKVDWTHNDGRVETIHDQPFDFDYQRSYTFDNFVVQPGDKLKTTCTYAAPAHFGKGTEDEMCYFFTVHWPAGALARENFFSQLHGANTCIDL
jgi:hypothetical protein